MEVGGTLWSDYGLCGLEGVEGRQVGDEGSDGEGAGVEEGRVGIGEEVEV